MNIVARHANHVQVFHPGALVYFLHFITMLNSDQTMVCERNINWDKQVK